MAQMSREIQCSKARQSWRHINCWHLSEESQSHSQS